MKKLRLLSLVGITSIALAQAGLAAGHGGGGGGFGGGGFGGGGHGGGFGGGRGGGGFGGARFGGGFSAPHVIFGGAMNRGGGGGFGQYRPSPAYHSYAPPAYHSFATSRSPVARSSAAPSSRNLTSVARGNQTRSNQSRTTTAINRTTSGRSATRSGQASQTVASRPTNEATLSQQHRIFARESGAQHQDWDRRHAHFFNGHWWCWDGGFWIGLDDGFYPWDFYPYYAYDYYPYDYYTDSEPVDEGYTAAQVAPTISDVQYDLEQLGYYNGPIDGVFGPDTRTALTRYQIDHQLQVTGSLSADTLQSLGLPGLASN